MRETSRSLLSRQTWAVAGALLGVVSVFSQVVMTLPAFTSTAAAATGAFSTVFVSNTGANTITSYPTTAGGNNDPLATLANPSTTTLDSPTGAAFDASGNLWVANIANETVVEYTDAQLASSGDPTPHVTISTTSAQMGSLSNPEGLAFDDSGDLWVANDADNTVVEFTKAQLASSGAPTPNAALLANSGSLNAPDDLVFDVSGDLWVTNRGNNTAVEFTKAQLASSGAPAPSVTLTSTSGSLDDLTGLAFDVTGDLWVANSGNNTVVEFAKAQLATSGAAAPSVTLTSTSGSLDDPTGLAFDASGDLWVANSGNDTVVEYGKTQLASSGAPAPFATILASSGHLVPGSLAFDASGDLWVTNLSNNTVIEYTKAQLASSGSPVPNVTISASSGSLDSPGNVAFDASGDLWVANNGANSVSEYTNAELAASGSPTPNVILTSASGSLVSPEDLAFDASGDLWVANGGANTVVEFARSQLGSSGAATPSVTLASSSGDLDDPAGVAFDSSGDLWVASYFTDTVVEYGKATLGSSGAPTPSVTLSSGSGSLNRPVGVTFDASGDLWVTSSNSNSVDEFEKAQLASTGAPTPFVTLLTNAGSLDNPAGLAFDASGDLWVANSDGNNVVAYSPAQLSSTGSPVPNDTIFGSNTGLNVPDGIAIAPPGAVAPTVTSISPSSGPTAGGTTVTLNGTGFTGATAVTVGGKAVASFTVVSSTKITAVTPALGTGSHGFNVTTAGGTSAYTSADVFVALAAPTVTSIAPSSGPTAGGTTVTLNGTGFTGATAVTVGGKAVASFTVVSSTKITAVTPALGTGSHGFNVTTAGGTSAYTSADVFAALAAPTVTSIAPSSGPTAGGTTVTLNGTGFTGATAVTVGGKAVASFTVVSSTKITAVTPALGTGSHGFNVTTAGGTSAYTSADVFVALAAPTVTSIAPSSGPTAGGTTVTLNGTGFTGATAVTVGGKAVASFTVVSSTKITAVTPALGTGSHGFNVTTAGGTSAYTSADVFAAG